MLLVYLAKRSLVIKQAHFWLGIFDVLCPLEPLTLPSLKQVVNQFYLPLVMEFLYFILLALVLLFSLLWLFSISAFSNPKPFLKLALVIPVQAREESQFVLVMMV